MIKINKTKPNKWFPYCDNYKRKHFVIDKIDSNLSEQLMRCLFV